MTTSTHKMAMSSLAQQEVPWVNKPSKASNHLIHISSYKTRHGTHFNSFLQVSSLSSTSRVWSHRFCHPHSVATPTRCLLNSLSSFLYDVDVVTSFSVNTRSRSSLVRNPQNRLVNSQVFQLSAHIMASLRWSMLLPGGPKSPLWSSTAQV